MAAIDFRVHHLGYAVATIEGGRAAFAALGWESFGEVTEDVGRNVRIAFLKKGEDVIELVAPLAKPNPVEKVLAAGVGVPYHICYEVDSPAAAEAELKAKKFLPFIRPTAAPALEGRRVEFLFNKEIGIIELVERI